MAKMFFPTASDSIEKEIECEQLIIDIDKQSLNPPRWPDQYCIYRVPNKLRKVKEDAYTPQLVSIGPFHHGQEQFRGMEIQKKRYLREFCNRTGKSYQDLSSIVEENEKQIRRCYSETVDLGTRDFVEMVLFDSVFIMELFLRTSDREKYKEDYIVGNPWFERHIKQDFLLLENQLPFNFLQKFYESAFNGNGEQEVVPSFLYLSCSYFLSDNNRKPEKKEVKHFTDLAEKKEVKHFTDLKRTFYCPTDLNCKPAGDLLFTSTKLGEAGLVFKKASDSPDRNLLDIHLSENKCLERFPCLNLSWLLACLPCLKSISCLERMRRILEVPQLVVDDRTEVLFRNLMALEQCHYPLETYICNYVVLLDYLITTKADVVFLVEKGIVVNRLGSSAAVTTLINKLGLEIVEVNSCYQDLIEELNRYHENHWNRLMASLTSVYFRDFWRGSATFAGIFVLCVAFWNFLRPFVLDT